MSRTHHPRTSKAERKVQQFYLLRSYFLALADSKGGARKRALAIQWLAELTTNRSIPVHMIEERILRRALRALTEGYLDTETP